MKDGKARRAFVALLCLLSLLAVSGGCSSAGPGLMGGADGGPVPDGGPDGGLLSDGGVDGGADGGVDGGPDGGVDGGNDGGAECRPGQRRCREGSMVQICDENFLWVDLIPCDTSIGESCQQSGNACLTPCQEQLVEMSNLGCSFWPVNLANYGNEPYDGGSTGPRYQAGVKLFVSNPQTGEATLTLTDRYTTFDLGQDAVIPAQSSVVFQLPASSAGGNEDIHVIDGSTITYAAFRLRASVPVFVYQFNPAIISTASSDASLLLPERALGLHYHVMTVPHSIKQDLFGTHEHPAGFVVVATRDNTTVTVKASAPTSPIIIPAHDVSASAEGHILAPMTSGEERIFKLNSHEVLALETSSGESCPVDKEPEGFHGKICLKKDDFVKGLGCHVYGRRFCQPGHDLTGTLIRSDKYVALYSTAKNAMVPYYMFGTEHLEEQLPPTTSWGRTFAVGRLAPRYRYYGCTRGNGRRDHLSTCPFGSGVSFYRIIASRPDTNITIKTPVSALTIEEAPKDFNYNNQVDWVTGPMDEIWGGRIAGKPCVVENGWCTVQHTLSPGAVLEFGDVFNHLISADKGIFITRLIPSEEYVGIPSYATPQAYMELLWFKGGDPAMTYLIPIGQFRSFYTINVIGQLKYGYLGLMAPRGARIILDEGTAGQVVLDSSDGTWESVGAQPGAAGEYLVRYYEIHNLSSRDRPRELPNSLYSDTREGGGYHTLKGEGNVLFGLEVYGFDHYISYAYPGGLALRKLNPL